MKQFQPMRFLHLDFLGKLSLRGNELLHNNQINSFVHSPILMKNIGPNFFHAPLP